MHGRRHDAHVDPDDLAAAGAGDLPCLQRMQESWDKGARQGPDLVQIYRALVRDKKIASVSAGFTGFPGNKYPHLFAFFAFPLPGHTPHEIEDAIHVEIERLKKEDITDDELKMIKTRAKANLVRGLAENEGLAFQLGQAQSRYGDWRESFRQVDRIDKVSKADIRRVANQIFVPTNRTVGIIENIPAASTNKGGQQ